MKYLRQVRLVAPLFFLLALSVFASAQQPTETSQTERGIQFYNQGEYDKAIEALQKAVKEKADDYVAWRYLGLSFYNQENYSNALKAFYKVDNRVLKTPDVDAKIAYSLLITNNPSDALNYAEKAVAENFKTAEIYYVLCELRFQSNKFEEALVNCNEAIKLNSEYAYAYLTKSMVLLNLKRNEESADCLEKFLQLKPFDEDARVWLEQIAELRKDNTKPQSTKSTQVTKSNNENDSASTPNEVSQKAMLTFKPQPDYLTKARETAHSGLVRIRAVLSSDGSVKHILVIKPLRFGLTTKAVNAVKRIQFKPATKDGKPVSQVVTLEYSFRIY